MKKLLALIALVGCFLFANTYYAVAQQDPEPQEEVTETDAESEPSFHQAVKEKFIEGGVEFMTPILIFLIIGLAISIERIITLNLETTNTKKFVPEIEEALKSGGADAAKDVAVNTRGAVASIYVQGLMRVDEGLDVVEKSVASYGGVVMGKLERGMIWISLMIAIAPMVGFMGTVYGMILAFDKIQAAGNLDASLIAGEIKVALLTTIGGLIVGVILQVFYNYCVSKIDNLVNQMEDSSITLIDMLFKYKHGILNTSTTATPTIDVDKS
ncbi:MAG: MotA/TolQ/ExbB proton channel family protein [Thermonemataceae bacterium]